MNFDQLSLDPRLLRNVRAAGYETPTPIQSAAIPPALQGHDLIGTAQTGTGKTAAFVLQILQRLLKNPLGQIFAFDYEVSGTWTDPKVAKLQPEPLPQSNTTP